MSALPQSIAANPRLSKWIAVGTDGVIEFRTGKVELGQGVVTAIAALVAGELKVPVRAIRVVSGDTRAGPDEGFTAGSLSLEQGGAAGRWVAATVRELFAEAAAARLKCERAAIRVEDGGLFTDGSNARLSYRELRDAVNLNRDLTQLPVPEFAGRWPSPAGERLDLREKLSGAAFIHDLQRPGLQFGRVLRPDYPGGELLSFDREAVLQLPGVTAVVVDGNFVGVVARREDDADRALLAAAKAARWRMKSLPPYDPEFEWLKREQPLSSTDVVAEEGAVPTRGAVVSHRASYAKPYTAHASMAPSCALAEWSDGRLTVWSHAQGPFPLRSAIASVLEVPLENVEVVHAMGAGCYGHNGADDVALDAALLARAANVPVLCRWIRKDEMSWSPFGPAMRVEISAEADESGKLVAWNQNVYSPPHLARPRPGNGSNLLAAWQIERSKAPFTPVNVPGLSAGDRNAVPLYACRNKRVTHHLLPQGPLRSSALRSLGAFANVFAIECFLDELAEKVGRDPIQFRLDNLLDERGKAVIAAVAEDARWQGRPAGGDGVGWGAGFARYKNSGAYCAVIAAVEISDGVRITSIHAAVDCGAAVHFDGVLNQIEGGIVQAASWTLKEEVKWSEAGIETSNWDAYPVLGFGECPPIAVNLLNRPDLPPLGVGECAAGPTAAAIGNAVAHALGMRIRALPFSRERLVKVVAAVQ